MYNINIIIIIIINKKQVYLNAALAKEICNFFSKFSKFQLIIASQFD